MPSNYISAMKWFAGIILYFCISVHKERRRSTELEYKKKKKTNINAERRKSLDNKIQIAIKYNTERAYEMKLN